MRLYRIIPCHRLEAERDAAPAGEQAPDKVGEGGVEVDGLFDCVRIRCVKKGFLRFLIVQDFSW